MKEADALQQAGFEVTVICNYFIEWAEKNDAELLQKVSWRCIKAGGNPSSEKLRYWYTKCRFRLALFINRFIYRSFLISERSQARAFDELLSAAKKNKADYYIAHNLGALAVAVKAAKFNKAACGFDFEDYYRGELNVLQTTELRRYQYLEEKYLPVLKYYSSSSELIAEAVGKDHPSFIGNKMVIRNCFPLSEQPPLQLKRADDKVLRLVWFSQTIGKDRGLEELFTALKILNDENIHLTLVGRCNDDMKELIGTMMPGTVHLAGIIPANQLPSFMAGLDAGLALETGFSKNNDIALSNKIFTYLLAGNAMILSATSMQEKFNDQYHAGEMFPVRDAEELAKKILLFKDHAYLNRQKEHNYTLAKEELNWETESRQFIKIFS